MEPFVHDRSMTDRCCSDGPSRRTTSGHPFRVARYVHHSHVRLVVRPSARHGRRRGDRCRQLPAACGSRSPSWVADDRGPGRRRLRHRRPRPLDVRAPTSPPRRSRPGTDLARRPVAPGDRCSTSAPGRWWSPYSWPFLVPDPNELPARPEAVRQVHGRIPEARSGFQNGVKVRPSTPTPPRPRPARRAPRSTPRPSRPPPRCTPNDTSADALASSPARRPRPARRRRPARPGLHPRRPPP